MHEKKQQKQGQTHTSFKNPWNTTLDAKRELCHQWGPLQFSTTAWKTDNMVKWLFYHYLKWKYILEEFCIT